MPFTKYRTHPVKHPINRPVHHPNPDGYTRIPGISPDELKNIRIELERLTLRQRQLISILMERGWLTYEEIAQNLRISVSRARNYVSEIIGRGFPVSKVDSVEGKKIGIPTTIQDFILEDRRPDTPGKTSGIED